MRRTSVVSLAIGIVGVAAVVALALVGSDMTPSYLGAWLTILALPLGALPLVMVGDLLGLPETRLLRMLRRLVALMPVAALLIIPVLLRLDVLYPSLRLAKRGLPGWWMTPGFFVIRALVFLVIWTALSFVFARAPGRNGRRRSILAGLGLALHVVFGTLAADDWAQLVEPGFTSSVYGLLFIAAQMSIAVCLAVVLTMTGRPEAEVARDLAADRRDLDATRQVATGLAVLLGIWGFLAFTQFLVAWSANLPREVTWYQHRAAGFGLVAQYSAAILCSLALVALLARDLSRHAGLIAWVAAALLVMHGLEMFWLVTPAFRASFSLTWADLAALAAAAGLGIGMVLVVDGRASRGRVGHGAA